MESEPVDGIIYTKEYKQWYQKLSPAQRMYLTCARMDEWRMVLEIEVREKNPDFLLPEIKAETFKRMYPGEFSQEETEAIATSIRNCWEKISDESKTVNRKS